MQAVLTLSHPGVLHLASSRGAGHDDLIDLEDREGRIDGEAERVGLGGEQIADFGGGVEDTLPPDVREAVDEAIEVEQAEAAERARMATGMATEGERDGAGVVA